MSGIRTIIGLLFLVGVVILQIFLSKREGRWPGLILPIISFIVAILYPLNMAIMPGMEGNSFWVDMLVVFILANIPTAIFMVIYFACREGHSRRKQLNKMNIQDLE